MGHAVVVISTEFLVTLLTQGASPAGYQVIADGMPVGSVVRDVRHRHRGGGIIEIIIEHDSFPETPATQPYPRLSPVMRVNP